MFFFSKTNFNPQSATWVARQAKEPRGKIKNSWQTKVIFQILSNKTKKMIRIKMKINSTNLKHGTQSAQSLYLCRKQKWWIYHICMMLSQHKTMPKSVIGWSREKSVNIVFLEKDTIVVLTWLHFNFQKWNTSNFFLHFANVVNFGLLSVKI